MIRFSDTQLVILSEAAQRQDRMVPVPLPAKMPARRAAMVPLMKTGCVREAPADATACWSRNEDNEPRGFEITECGLEAIGLVSVDHSSNPRAADKPNQTPTRVAARPNAKIALVLSSLARDEGASITELVQLTGWQAHSARAALAGLRKQGHTIARRRSMDGETVYSLIRPTAAESGMDR